MSCPPYRSNSGIGHWEFHMAVYNPNGTTVSASARSYSIKNVKSNNTPGPDFAARTAA